MKLMLGFIGVLTILGGVWPLIAQMGFIPESVRIIPSSGVFYQAIIILIGVIALVYAIKKRDQL